MPPARPPRPEPRQVTPTSPVDWARAGGPGWTAAWAAGGAAVAVIASQRLPVEPTLLGVAALLVLGGVSALRAGRPLPVAAEEPEPTRAPEPTGAARVSELRGALGDLLDAAAGRRASHAPSAGPALPQPFFLGELAEDALASLYRVAARHGVALCLDAELEGDVEVRGDPALVRQLLDAVIRWSIAHTAHGYVELRIRHRAGTALVTFMVEDSGAGVREVDLPRFFDPDGAAADDPAHAALVVAHELAVALGGNLAVDSTLDVGTTFRLSLQLPPTGRVRSLPDLRGVHVAVASPWVQRTATLTRLVQRLHGRVIDLAADPEQAPKVDLVLVDQSVGAAEDHVEEAAAALGLPASRVVTLVPPGTPPGPGQVPWPGRRAALAEALAAVRGLGATPARAPSSRPSPAVAAPVPTRAPAAQPSPQRAPRRGVCVLVVDDQPVHAGLLQRLLEGFGVEVDVATSGREATEVFAPERHDLVFLDVLMPGMNGVETAAWLRAHVDPDARVPLVAVTGLDADALAGRGGLDRFDDVLAKPIGERAVRDVVRRLLGGVEVPPERAPVQAERAGSPRAEPLRSVPDADPRVVRFRGAGGGGAAPDPRPVADAQAEARVRLVVDDVTVEVPDGFADDTLARVLRALRRR